MNNDQFVATIQQLIADCRSIATATPDASYLWLDRAEALEKIIESEDAPAIAPGCTTTTLGGGNGSVTVRGK